MKGNGPAAKAAVKEREPEPEPETKPEPVKFRRGDVVVFVRNALSYASGNGPEEREHIEVGQVTSITREGGIGAYRDLAMEGLAPTKMANSGERHATAYRLDQTKWDTAAIARTVHARDLAPFHSMADVRTAFRPHKRT